MIAIAAIDWIMLAILLASLLLGAWRGLVFEVLSVAGWIAAFVLAQLFAPQVAAWLPMSGATETVRYAAGFVALFVVVLFAAGFLAWVVKKMVEAVGLRPIDRVLGAVFGALRGVLLLLAATVVVGMTPLQASPAWKESAGAPMLASLLKSLKPMLPEQFGKLLN
jgi:membrane protein required for colicin V production